MFELYLRKEERLEDINRQIRHQLQSPKCMGQRTMKKFLLNQHYCGEKWE